MDQLRKYNYRTTSFSGLGAVLPREVRSMYKVIPSLNSPVFEGQKVIISNPDSSLIYDDYVVAPMLLITRDIERCAENQIRVIGTMHTDHGAIDFDYTYDYDFLPFVTLEIPAIDNGKGIYVAVNSIDITIVSSDFITCALMQRDIWESE